MRKLMALPAWPARTLVMGAVASAMSVVAWVGPAHGQSLLQSLFGLGSSPQVHVPQRSRPITQPPRFGVPATSWRAQQEVDSTPEGRQTGGGYTTVCVRLCDGFYFPVSSRAGRDKFQRDADACRSRCGLSDSRLFYYSNAGGGMETAVDMGGRGYTRLQNAFLHRKRLVSGCACKPEPWSAASIRLHQSYAQNESPSLIQTGMGRGTVAVLSGNYGESGSANGGKLESSDAPAADEAATDKRASASPQIFAAAIPVSVAVVAPAKRSANQVAANSKTRAVAQVARAPVRQTVRVQAPPVRLQAAAPRTQIRVASATSGGLPSFGSSGGGAKMRWPGDSR